MRIAIVGAGFAGLIAARELSKVSHVVIYEEHEEVGVPEHCTGIVSERVVEEIGESAKRNVEGYLEEFKVGLPSGKGITLKGPKRFTAKLNRVGLEKDLLEEILSEGVEFRNEMVLNVSKDARVNDEAYDRAIIAEGWRAELSKRLGIAHKARIVYGINFEVKGKTAHPGSVEIWFDKALAPGFFAWVVMLEDKAVVGTASEPRKANVRELAKKVKEIAEKRDLIKGGVTKEYGGVILTGPPALSPCTTKVCSFGDAAGLNKPLTGGGLYPNTVIAKRFPDTFPNLRKAYYPLVERLRLETILARIAHKAPQRFYEKFFENMNGMEIRINEYDNHLRTLREMGIGNLLRLLGVTLRSLF
ncbi:hypothetical protein IPA_03300 [Ignicoccus pacificus DSM 13166]|uniref:Dehydrogenase n=1 Tax=Ignicoccus pacificus DSM 13166 TaxID=940294 RepID=A0A977KAW7_9CREN|nr:hypothetical protein IPA_03300 [Ignicoccus pacificus DSM 13166]